MKKVLKMRFMQVNKQTNTKKRLFRIFYQGLRYEILAKFAYSLLIHFFMNQYLLVGTKEK